PDSGNDEIARVASAFNTMAAELAARDEALRTSDRLRRQMIADVSHELKTPLTAMRGYLETLRMRELNLPLEDRARYIDIVERETHRLERIVQDLLDLARLESQAVSLNSRVFATERVFTHVTNRYELERRQRGVHLMTRVDPAADQMVGDPDRIEQVLDNLVANPLRYTPS